MLTYVARCLARALLISLIASRAGAQTKIATTPVALAFELGRVTSYDESPLLAGIRVSPPKPGVGGVDVAFATFPDALLHGNANLLIDLDGTFGWPLGGDDVGVFPRGGISVGAGTGAVIGYNAGIGVLGRISHRVGLRFDYTHRRFLEGNEQMPFSSVTAGVVLLLP